MCCVAVLLFRFSFIEYRADTGSWVFEVKHFSKYRLDDSDDEGDGVAATGNTTNATTIPRHPLNVPSRKQSVLEDDNQRTVGFHSCPINKPRWRENRIFALTLQEFATGLFACHKVS